MTPVAQFKVNPMNTPDIVDWLMTHYGSVQYNKAWEFPTLPSTKGMNFKLDVPLEDQLPPVVFRIHNPDLAVLFKLTWSHVIVT